PDLEPRNKALEQAARQFAEALIELVEARGRAVWGAPDYHFTVGEVEEVPAWIEDLPRCPDRLVGWRRGRGKVAVAYWEHEGRIIRVNVYLAVGALCATLGLFGVGYQLWDALRKRPELDG